MSLNWKEIDRVLSELDLAGAQVQRILQPSFDTVVFGLYGRGIETDLLVSVAHGACRLHRLSHPIPKNDRPLRFMECLRSRLRGGRLLSIAQLGEDRIVRLDFAVSREGEDGAPLGRSYSLFARLWSGAGNLILCDEDGRIVDALMRRPSRDEVAGLPFSPPSSPAGGGDGARPTRSFEIRDLPAPEGSEAASFNARVEAFYERQGGELSLERLRALAGERHTKRRSFLEARIASLEERARRFADSGRNRELGDIIMANLHLPPGGKHLEAEDFFRGGTILIPLDPRLGLVENARTYYDRAKKEAGGLAEVELEVGRWKAELARAEEEEGRLLSLDDPILLAKALGRGGTARRTEEGAYPGLSLDLAGWRILVGRSAKENDELLRRHVRGSDLWLHARDWAGAYVFIKARKGKSVPLEVLLDAGSLALYYSKGRANGEGDLYYTFVKYLRRAKDGPQGLVIPTQEKNLFVRIDEARIKELRSLIGGDSAG